MCAIVAGGTSICLADGSGCLLCDFSPCQTSANAATKPLKSPRPLAVMCSQCSFFFFLPTSISVSISDIVWERPFNPPVMCITVICQHNSVSRLLDVLKGDWRSFSGFFLYSGIPTVLKKEKMSPHLSSTHRFILGDRGSLKRDT